MNSNKKNFSDANKESCDFLDKLIKPENSSLASFRIRFDVRLIFVGEVKSRAKSSPYEYHEYIYEYRKESHF